MTNFASTVYRSGRVPPDHFFCSVLKTKTLAMNPEKFMALPGYKQESIIFTEGNFVDSKVEDKKIFALYSIHTFFVELEYDTVNYRISSKKAFTDGRELHKYLDWQ